MSYQHVGIAASDASRQISQAAPAEPSRTSLKVAIVGTLVAAVVVLIVTPPWETTHDAKLQHTELPASPMTISSAQAAITIEHTKSSPESSTVTTSSSAQVSSMKTTAAKLTTSAKPTTTAKPNKAIKPSAMSLPSLLCIALILPYGFEPGLMEALYQKKLSLFSCDEYVVYSNRSIPETSFPLHTVMIPMDVRNNPETHNPLNTPVFMKVLKLELSSRRYLQHDWVVKVDPDTVFFPGRLQSMLSDAFPAARDPGSVFLQNCKSQLLGAIEVISRKAIETFFLNADEMCLDIYGEATVSDETMAFGEDQFMQRCLSRLDVQQMQHSDLLSDSKCSGLQWQCKGDFAAFHPFTSKDEYLACVDNAIGPMWETST